LILKSILLTLKVNEKQMKKVTESSNLIALDIAEELVQKGIPFRVTHKIAGILVQLAHQSKKPISKLTFTEIKKSVVGTKVDPKIVSKIISSTTVVSSLKNRKSFGSSGYDEQKRMISDRTQKINNYRIAITERENKINSSIGDLEKQINEIIQ
jgi:argininosuccinate lyase